MKIPFFPEQASTSAVQVDHLYFFLLLISALVVAVVALPMFYFLFKYRRGNVADRAHVEVSTWKIEVTWTVIPFLLTTVMFAWGARVYFEMEVPPANALEINVVGKQWMWKIQHPEGNREINELHVPVGRTIKLTLASEDVIHSFYIPAFRLKQDVVPGRYVTEWFQPTKPGKYHLFCAEFCGADHSKMIGSIYVMEPADYQTWLATLGATNTLAETGATLYRTLGCSGCHTGQGTVRAPPLEGIYGKPVPLQDGSIVIADDKYLRDSILLPASQVAAGYQPVMPTFQGRLNEEEVFQLIAYIKAISSKPPEEKR